MSKRRRDCHSGRLRCALIVFLTLLCLMGVAHGHTDPETPPRIDVASAAVRRTEGCLHADCEMADVRATVQGVSDVVSRADVAVRDAVLLAESAKVSPFSTSSGTRLSDDLSDPTNTTTTTTTERPTSNTTTTTTETPISNTTTTTTTTSTTTTSTSTTTEPITTTTTTTQAPKAKRSLWWVAVIVVGVLVVAAAVVLVWYFCCFHPKRCCAGGTTDEESNGREREVSSVNERDDAPQPNCEMLGVQKRRADHIVVANPLSPLAVSVPTPVYRAGDRSHINDVDNIPYTTKGVVPWTGRAPVLRGPQPTCFNPNVTEDGVVIPREERVPPVEDGDCTPVMMVSVNADGSSPTAASKLSKKVKGKLNRIFGRKASTDEYVAPWYHRLVQDIEEVDTPELSDLDYDINIPVSREWEMEKEMGPFSGSESDDPDFFSARSPRTADRPVESTPQCVSANANTTRTPRTSSSQEPYRQPLPSVPPGQLQGMAPMYGVHQRRVPHPSIGRWSFPAQPPHPPPQATDSNNLASPGTYGSLMALESQRGDYSTSWY